MDSPSTELLRRLIAANDLGFCLELGENSTSLIYLDPMKPTVKSLLNEEQRTNGFRTLTEALDAVDASLRALGKPTLLERYNAYLHRMALSEPAITG